MPTITDTRTRLLQAAEQLFARDGIERAQIKEITRLAGQRNESALHYHFGSRMELLRAVLMRHLEDVEVTRSSQVTALAVQGLTGDLGALVKALVMPAGTKLETAEGQDYLLILRQCLGHISYQSLPAETPPSLAQLIGWIRAALPPLPEPVVKERIDFAVSAMSSALAERVLAIRGGEKMELDNRAFLENLAAMLRGALGAG